MSTHATSKHDNDCHLSANGFAKELDLDPKDPAALVSAGEFILESLYANNRLSKASIRGKTFFRK